MRASPAPGRSERATSRTSSPRCRSSFVSTTLKDPEWNNTTVLGSGDATAQVSKLKEEFDGELQTPGSHRLVQELIESDLVDQVNLMVFPVILRTGKKAFEETPERRIFRLKESKVVGDGVVVLIYERNEPARWPAPATPHLFSPLGSRIRGLHAPAAREGASADRRTARESAPSPRSRSLRLRSCSSQV